MDTVTVGCRLPHGLVLEVGHQVTEKSQDGKRITSVRRNSNYQRFTLKGTNQHLIQDPNNWLPSRIRPAPFINRNVPKDLWEEWITAHKNSWHVKSGNIFLCKDEADVQVHLVDAQSVDAPLQPMDPRKAIVVGVEKADFVSKAA